MSRRVHLAWTHSCVRGCDMWHMFSMRVTSCLVDRRAEDGRLQHWLHAGPCLPLQSCIARPTELSYFLPSGFLSCWVETAQPTPTHAQDRRPRGACYVADTRAVRTANMCLLSLRFLFGGRNRARGEKIFMNRAVCVYFHVPAAVPWPRRRTSDFYYASAMILSFFLLRPPGTHSADRPI